ncbi:MAG: hypothetical protein AB8C84_05100 [Oligoflexales bacterium]
MKSWNKRLNGFVITALILPTIAKSLPIGFYTNQGAREYQLLASKHFQFFHDTESLPEAKALMDATNNLRPYAEQWFGMKRRSPLPVVMSGVSSHASFANFLLDTIELQTLGQGDRDLMWHEYTHAMMYLHFSEPLGQAWALWHLPWMPAWFLEGLAEAMSRSIGSDATAAIERYSALHDDWFHLDDLHSLYRSKTSYAGYAASGAFVSWLLEKGLAKDFPKFMEKFYSRTLPWYWPLTLIPSLDALPMDASLKWALGKNAPQLYKMYKKEAKSYWFRHDHGPLLTTQPGARSRWSGAPLTFSIHGQLYGFFRDHESIRPHLLNFSTQNWVVKSQPLHTSFPLGENPQIATTNLLISTEVIKDQNNQKKNTNIILRNKEEEKIITVPGFVTHVTSTGSYMIWLEKNINKTSLCYSSLHQPEKKICPIEESYPRQIAWLGTENKDRVWLRLTTETPAGDQHKILVWDQNLLESEFLSPPTDGSTPLQLTRTGDTLWMLKSFRTGRYLEKISTHGLCLAQSPVADLVYHIEGMKEGDLALTLYDGEYQSIYRYRPAERPCQRYTAHTSPYLIATNSNQFLSLENAVSKSSLWQPPTLLNKAKQAPPSGTHLPPHRLTKPAPHHAHSPFFFPWVGGDDPLGGLQIGLVGVPWIDKLQNHTLRTSLLVGTVSQFPTVDISYTNRRHHPSWVLQGFNRQLFNGYINTRPSYLQEFGLQWNTASSYHIKKMSGQWSFAVKSSKILAYVGAYNPNRTGLLIEPSGDVSISTSFGKGRTSFSLGQTITPGFLNKNFNYNQLRSSLSASYPMFKSSHLSLAFSGSRTRGSKRRNLMELYSPLQTFIPGTGGGYNKNSFPVLGSGSLFSLRYGDTKARAQLRFTQPVIQNFNKVFWILFAERLDFSAFLNYGGAWYGPTPSSETFSIAHGYNLDFQLENKGVRFNVGLGAGQVLGNSFQVYLTTGFDSLF